MSIGKMVHSREKTKRGKNICFCIYVIYELLKKIKIFRVTFPSHLDNISLFLFLLSIKSFFKHVILYNARLPYLYLLNTK